MAPRPSCVALACAVTLLLAAAALPAASAAKSQQPADYEEVRFTPSEILQEQNRAIDRANYALSREEARPTFHRAPMDIAHHMPRSPHATPFEGELYDGGDDASFAQESSRVSAEPAGLPSDELPAQYELPTPRQRRAEPEPQEQQEQQEQPQEEEQAPEQRGASYGGEFRFRDRRVSEQAEQQQEQEQQEQRAPQQQHHVLTQQAVLAHVARSFFQTALQHMNAELIEMESMAGQEVVQGHQKRSRNHRTTRLLHPQSDADDDGSAFIEEQSTVREVSRIAAPANKGNAVPHSKVIERLHLMTLPKNMRLPSAAPADKFLGVAAPTETIELEIDPVVRTTNGHRKVLTDKETDGANMALPSEAQDNTLRTSATSKKASPSRASSRSGRDQRDKGSDDDGEGAASGDGDDGDDDDDDDDGSASGKDGGLKLIEEGDHVSHSLFEHSSASAGAGAALEDDQALFDAEPKEASDASMHGLGRVEDNKQYDSFLQSQARSRVDTRADALMHMRRRRGFFSSVVNGVKSVAQKVGNFVSGVFGGNKEQPQQQQQQQKAKGKTPQDIEDCVGCKLVWSQVEMDVGNARYIEDVQASFEHNCMDAQKSTIFYEACEDMYDDMYAMTDDYMSNKFPVTAMCARAKMCQA